MLEPPIPHSRFMKIFPGILANTKIVGKCKIYPKYTQIGLIGSSSYHILRGHHPMSHMLYLQSISINKNMRESNKDKSGQVHLLRKSAQFSDVFTMHRSNILWQWIELGDWLPCGFSTGEHLEFCCGCFVSCCGSNSAIQSRQANWRLITGHIWKTLPTSWTSSKKNQHESTPDFNQTWLFYMWITTDQWGWRKRNKKIYIDMVWSWHKHMV